MEKIFISKLSAIINLLIYQKTFVEQVVTFLSMLYVSY